MSSTPNSPAAGASITAMHSDIVQSNILSRLDGPTLAVASCASAQFLSLSNHDALWKDISNSTWPSTTDPRVASAISAFPSGHRSFYSDSFPSLRHQHPPGTYRPRIPDTTELISAVDIYHDGRPIYSKAVVTETVSTWFLSTPFRIELLEEDHWVPTPLTVEVGGTCIERAEESLRVSWILIDPVNRRAAKMASHDPVEARRHWLTDDIQLRFATVLTVGGELVLCLLLFTCGRREGEEGRRLYVKQVTMQMEEIEGKIVNGLEGLRFLEEAMEGQRCKITSRAEKDIYERFKMSKVKRIERKERRESEWDMVCVLTGILFSAFSIYYYIYY